MTFQVCSDIHLEFILEKTEYLEKLLPPIGDYLILAGDIDYAENLDEVFEYCSNKWEKVIFVPGNHEYYGTYIDMGNIIMKELCESYGIILLNPGIYEIDNYYIIGATLWSNPIASELRNIICNINDFSYINDNDISDHVERHKRELKFILDSIENAPKDKEIIVITHFVPDLETARLDGSKLTSYFGTNITHLVKRKIKAWIYGHSHINTSTIINGIQLISNQIGYEENKMYNSSFLL